MKIHNIGEESIHNICSSQVIFTLSSVVKELVENSIDAGANEIKIKLVENGIKLIEVNDNGIGIKRVNFENVCARHATSKISEFNDIQNSLNTLGFRGEALNSLCMLSDVHITTKNDDCSDHGYLLKFDKLGKLYHEEPIARLRGTTVSCENIFKNIPIRKKDFIKNIKTQLSDLLLLMQQYAIIYYHIKFVIYNVVTIKGHTKNMNLLITNGNENIKKNFYSIYGKKNIGNLIELNIDNEEWKIRGYISDNNSGRRDKDLQFYYMNSRPVHILKNVNKIINTIYREFNSRLYPIIICNILADPKNVDVNVTPDKREIFFTFENEMCEQIKLALVKLLTPKTSNLIDTQIGDYFLKVNNIAPAKNNYAVKTENHQVLLEGQSNGNVVGMSSCARAQNGFLKEEDVCIGNSYSNGSGSDYVNGANYISGNNKYRCTHEDGASYERDEAHSAQVKILNMCDAHCTNGEVKNDRNNITFSNPDCSGNMNKDMQKKKYKDLSYQQNCAISEYAPTTVVKSDPDNYKECRNVYFPTDKEQNDFYDSSGINVKSENDSRENNVYSYSCAQIDQTIVSSENIRQEKELSNNGEADYWSQSKRIERPNMPTQGKANNYNYNVENVHSNTDTCSYIKGGYYDDSKVYEYKLEGGDNNEMYEYKQEGGDNEGVYEYKLEGGDNEGVYEYKLEGNDNKGVYEYKLEDGNDEGVYEHKLDSGKNEGVHEHKLDRGKNEGVYEYKLKNEEEEQNNRINENGEDYSFDDLKENIRNSCIKNIPIDINMYINREKMKRGFDYDQIHVINLTNSEKIKNIIFHKMKEEVKVNNYLCLTDDKQENEYKDLFNSSLNLSESSSTRNSSDINAINNSSEDINFNNIDEKQKDLYFKSNLFDKLKICGQFNKGFVISKIDLLYFKNRNNQEEEGEFNKNYDGTDCYEEKNDKRSNYALFIIDQHAADEKSNFEKYNKVFTMKSQKLISKIDLELSPAQIHIVEKNFEIFLQNGFEVEIVEEPIHKKRKVTDITSYTEEETLMEIKVYLLSLPVFNGKILEVVDFMSLLHHLTEYPITYDKHHFELFIKNKDQPNKKTDTWFNYNFPRPQKVWRILASKACRNAIMVGKTLNITEMIKIKKKLSVLKNPWNCPHGRPTIKYVINDIDIKNCYKNYYLKLYDEITNLIITKNYEAYKYLFHNHIFFLIMSTKPLLGPVLKFH
ncbi:DNA mismatch repair protein PMS1, putative [Plasmodium malariae]|uniref:DNA mismatch repair protein PMS1, putative n=1 Tax=Plasmodium malariae TaxID=5858 RepID=A0A1A8VQ03_PLAMA|nr:DNA mismatch repair protein PMS1, putative [Plasmodium malariae]SBS81735.1 DNA mismatch repair protein PMS2 [Plasmodium malariae]SBT87163.1 DNA mismatch repair protein PMS1, putative [Plasmodium malariae]